MQEPKSQALTEEAQQFRDEDDVIKRHKVVVTVSVPLGSLSYFWYGCGECEATVISIDGNTVD